MTCFFCKGEKEKGVTIDVTDAGSCVIVIRGVPCYKCTQCGETTFDLAVGERLEQIVDNLKNSISEIAVVQYANVAA